jgi:general secretion pathway protein G
LVTTNAEKMTTNADSFFGAGADASHSLRPRRGSSADTGNRSTFEMTVVHTKRTTTTGSRGFTLIELLVVIAILGFIASLVGPSVIKQFGGAKVDAARLQIADLSAALDLYYLDLGRYPTTAEGLAALVSAPESVRDWDGPYLKKSAVPSDPWGNAYQYKAPGESSPYDLLSYGADSQQGGERDNADVVSWE